MGEKRLRRKYSPLAGIHLKKGIFMEKAPCRSIFQKRNRPHHAGIGYTNLGSSHQSGRKGKHHPREGKRIAGKGKEPPFTAAYRRRTRARAPPKTTATAYKKPTRPADGICPFHGWEIYEIYIDDDYSGADRSRPAFKRMLHAAEEKRFDIILCKNTIPFQQGIRGGGAIHQPPASAMGHPLSESGGQCRFRKRG